MHTERFKTIYGLTKSALDELRKEFDATFPESVDEVIHDSAFSMRILCSLLLENPELLRHNEKKFLALAESVAKYTYSNGNDKNFNGSFRLKEDIYKVVSSKAMESYMRQVGSKIVEMELARAWRALVRCSFHGLTTCDFSFDFFKNWVPQWNKKFPYAVRAVYETMLADTQGKRKLSIEKTELLEQYKTLSGTE